MIFSHAFVVFAAAAAMGELAGEGAFWGAPYFILRVTVIIIPKGTATTTGDSIRGNGGLF